jgi:subtilisin family serine protease
MGALLAPPVASAAGRPADDRAKVIVMFEGPPGKAAERAIEKIGGKVDKKLTLVNGLAARVPKGQLRQLAKEPGVRAVEPDVTLTAFDHGANTGDLEYENAWGVEHIGTPAIHAAGVWGDGVKVAVIDTGIDYIHDDPDNSPYVVDPEFLGNYKGGFDFVNHDAYPLDDNGHGTHVAGILAAEKNGYLVSGVAPHVDLYGLKILSGAGTGDESDLILALQWALDNDMDIVNMSLGTHTNVPALATAVANASAAGLLMVAASGNVNPGNINELLYGCAVAYPAAYPQVLATTFTNGSNALTGYSCTGPEVDFASPGDQIISAVPIGPCQVCDAHGYKALSGTSMASPHLAGTVALMLDAGISDAGDPGLFDDIEAQLCATANTAFGVNTTPIPKTDARYAKYFGCGILNADGAVLPLITNDSPVAVDDTATTAEDTPVSVDVVANDTDPNGDTLAASAVTDPPHGTAAVQFDGSVLYTPDADYNGPDAFGYTVDDGTGNTDTGSVSVTVTPSPDAPVAVDDVLVALSGASANVAVLANDSDPDGDTVSVTSITQPAHGTTTPELDGSVTYQPSGTYNGPDGFDYSISDGNGGTATAHVAVSVVLVNQPPVAVDDAASVNEDASVVVSVLANDSDPDGGAITVTSVGSAAHGSTTLNPDGTVTYVPTANSNGSDAFGYTVRDSVGFTDSGMVSVTVLPVNDDPTAVPDSVSINEDAATTIDVVANDSDIDGDALDAVSVGGAPLGVASVNPDGTILYTPPAQYYGLDEFTYTVSDGNGGSATSNVSVSIAAVNDTPTADLKSVTTSYQTSIKIAMTGADVETCDLTFQIVTPPAHGSLGAISNSLCVTLLPPYSDKATVRYTPASGWFGTDSFTYRVRDGVLWSAPATVSVTTSDPIRLHVGDLDPSTTVGSTTWTARVTITVDNGTEATVSGVTVAGTWSGGASGTATCKTNSVGVCTISKSSIPKATTGVTFTVTNLTLSPTGVYQPGSNHDPDPDSDGTTIVVLLPA